MCDVEVCVGFGYCYVFVWCLVEEVDVYEIWFYYVFDCFCFFVYGDGECVEFDWFFVEVVDECVEDGFVQLVEFDWVDVVQFESCLYVVDGCCIVVVYQGVVVYMMQELVGDLGGVFGLLGDF